MTRLEFLTPLLVLTSLALLFVSGPSPVVAESGRCEIISEPLCRLHINYPYNLTLTPNKFGQSQSEASEALPEWLSSLPERSRCKKSARKLVCVTFFPVCNIMAILVPPCRETCEQVRELCVDDLRRLDYEWPDELSCDDLPVNEEGTLCIRPSEEDTAEEPTALPTEGTSARTAYDSTTGSWTSTARPWTSTARPWTSTTEAAQSSTPASTPAYHANPLTSLRSLLSQLPEHSGASSTASENPTGIPDQVRNILVGYLGRFDRMVKLQEEIMILQKSKLELEVQLLHRKRWS